MNADLRGAKIDPDLKWDLRRIDLINKLSSWVITLRGQLFCYRHEPDEAARLERRMRQYHARWMRVEAIPKRIPARGGGHCLCGHGEWCGCYPAGQLLSDADISG